MAKENEEETPKENPEEEEEPTVEKPQEGEQVTPEEPEKTSSELEEKNKRLYARMKKAEEEAKLAKEELAKKKEGPSIPTDVFDLAKTVSTLKDYNSEELDFIQMMSKAKNISPEEAAKTEEAKLYISARRRKVEAEKSMPEPSTKQDISKKPIEDITNKDLDNMSLKQKEGYLQKVGWVK